MAKVTIFCMKVWRCEDCDTVLKAHTVKTLVTSAEYHMFREHEVGFNGQWEPYVTTEHWAFHTAPENVDHLEIRVGQLRVASV